MANTSGNVTAGKPATTGAIYCGPLATQLPTDAKTALNAGFKCLGYVSEDGLKNDNSPETSNVKAWGGDTVLALQTAKEDKFVFKLIEAMNEEVLKVIYGSGNVSGTLSTGITIEANADEAEQCAWVFEMVLKGGYLKRIVVPKASVTDLGSITYSDSDAVGYDVTITAVPDASGNTHYEYIEL